MSEGVVCPQCQQVCKNDRGLKIHQSMKHRINDTPAANDSKEKKSCAKESVATDVAGIVCLQCRKVCKNEQGLKIHQSKHKSNASSSNNSEAKSNVKKIFNSQKSALISDTKEVPEEDTFLSDTKKQMHGLKIDEETKKNSNAADKKTSKKSETEKIDNHVQPLSKEHKSKDTKLKPEFNDNELSKVQTFACPICKKSLPTLRGFRIHAAKLHPHCYNENYSSEEEECDVEEESNDNKKDELTTSLNSKDKIKPNLTEWRNMGNEISHEITFRLRSTMNRELSDSPVKWQTMSTGSHVEITKVYT